MIGMKYGDVIGYRNPIAWKRNIGHILKDERSSPNHIAVFYPYHQVTEFCQTTV